MMQDQKQGLWEKNSEQFEITWKDPKNPFNWEWNEWNYTKAYNTAALLNRVVDAHSKFSMWNLGSFKTIGINMTDCINKDISYVYNNFGDVYDHEQRLFKQYKTILETKAGR
jgi:hypothetical protein